MPPRSRPRRDYATHLKQTFRNLGLPSFDSLVGFYAAAWLRLLVGKSRLVVGFEIGGSRKLVDFHIDWLRLKCVVDVNPSFMLLTSYDKFAIASYNKYVITSYNEYVIIACYLIL